MTEEKDKNEAQTKESAEKAETTDAKPKSNLMKYIMYTVGGIVLVGGIAFGTAYFLVGSQSTDNTEATETKQAEVKKEEAKDEPQTKPESDGDDGDHLAKLDELEQEGEEFVDDSVDLEYIDRSAIEKIVDNLEFLDYTPDESEIATESGMTVEDSIQEMNWIEKEKSQLAERETALNKREKELNLLQKDVDAKIIRIDQAESNRINQLAKLYDGMDSRAVAQLMMALDDETVVSIIPRMKSKQASMVLQLIPSKRAAKLSKQMITIAGN